MGKGGDDAVWNVWYFFSVFLEKKKSTLKKKKKQSFTARAEHFTQSTKVSRFYKNTT